MATAKVRQEAPDNLDGLRKVLKWLCQYASLTRSNGEYRVSSCFF